MPTQSRAWSRGLSPRPQPIAVRGYGVEMVVVVAGGTVVTGAAVVVAGVVGGAAVVVGPAVVVGAAVVLGAAVVVVQWPW